jgi:membrane associated rhomboid family serine protease
MIPLKDNVALTRVPVITVALILASLVAYVLAAVHGGSLIAGPSSETIVRYGAIPYEFAHWGQHCALGPVGFSQALLCSGQHDVVGHAAPQPATWETAFSAMFLQANILHLAVNMTFLGFFGASVEDRVGRLVFLGFYLAGGLVALALQVIVAPGSATPMLGASGAIAAVLGAYIVLHPRAKIRTLVGAIFRVAFVELDAWVVLVAWFAFDALLGAVGLSTAFGGSADAAYYAHWGGFPFGALVALALLGRHREQGAQRPAAASSVELTPAPRLDACFAGVETFGHKILSCAQVAADSPQITPIQGSPRRPHPPRNRPYSWAFRSDRRWNARTCHAGGRGFESRRSR